MSEENISVAPDVDPVLEAPPHVLSAIMQMIAGEAQLAISQQEHILSHLVECHECRVTAIVLLSAALQYEQSHSDSETLLADLLMRFVEIDHDAEVRKLELLGVYAEAIVCEGESRAEQRFPNLAIHVRSCEVCRAIVKTTVASLLATEGDC